MKTMFVLKKWMKACVMIGAVSLVMTSCDDDDDDINNRPYTISGNASGGQMVPAITGSGTGAISGTYNPSTGVMTYRTDWNGLTGGPSSGGFYNGASGVSGTAVGDPWNMGTGLTGTGNYSGTMNLTADQASQLTSGGWYYSMGTTANPGGEVRGQISATR